MGCCCGKHKKSSFNPSEGGPIKNRSCTDIICLVIFFAAIVGFVTVGIFAWVKGDPLILLLPTDSNGRICGVQYGDLDLSNKTNIFFFDLTKCASPSSYLEFQCVTPQVCVNSCPNSTWTYIQDLAYLTAAVAPVTASAGGATVTNTMLSTYAQANLGLDWNKYICKYDFDPKAEFEKGTGGASDLQAMITAEKCSPYYIPMSPIVNRCIPSVVTDAANFVADSASGQDTTVVDALNQTVTGTNLEAGSEIIQAYLNAQDIAMKIFSDFTSSWYWILAGLGVAGLVAFIWIVIMRWIAGPIVWSTILAFFCVMGFGIYYTYTEWQRLLNVNGANATLISTGFTTDLSQYLALKDTWLAFFIILCIVTSVFLLIVIFLRKRILIAIQIIQEASKAVAHMISTLFYPIVTFILAVIVVAFWGATELFLASSGDPVYRVLDTNTTRVAAETEPFNNTGCIITEWNEASYKYANDSTVKCIFIGYGGNSVFHQNTLGLQIAIVFAFFWLLNWVTALGQCTLAGAFASYYWAFDKSKDIPALPLFSAFGRSLRYHTGSLAFGSFIIALIQMVRVLLEYLDHKMREAENKVARFFLCICKCCCWCLEKFMKFLNRNAYIMIAVYGENFCWSAKEAFKLILKNILRVAVVDKVTDFLLLMGKLIVTAGLVALSWAFFGNKISFAGDHVPSLNYYWMPIVVIGIGSYIIASGFFNTYGMAVDTIFLCFLEDLQRNDGSEEKPYFMSKGLMAVLGKKNKKPKGEKDEKKKKKDEVKKDKEEMKQKKKK